MKMPALDKQILSRRRQIVGDLEAIIASAGGSGLTAGSVISDPISLKAYECDGSVRVPSTANGRGFTQFDPPGF